MRLPLLLLWLAGASSLFAQSFTEVPQFIPLEGVAASAVAFADVDGDGAPDALVTGRNAAQLPRTTLYHNDGSGSFLPLSTTTWVNVSDGDLAFADVDGDGDADVLVTGQDSAGFFHARLYRNDGTGTFTEASGTPFAFKAVIWGGIAFGDVDGDGDVDLLITGREYWLDEPIAKLYHNDGTGTFTEVSGTPFEPVMQSRVEFADLDGDQDLDVLLVGQDGTGEPFTALYLNDGSGTYTEASGTGLGTATLGAMALADVDGDQDLDILLSGVWVRNAFRTLLYLNAGNASFTESVAMPFGAIPNGTLSWADVNGDQAPDLLITGSKYQPTGLAHLYLNDGSGGFAEVSGTSLATLANGALAWADVDGDSDLDLLLAGWTGSTPVTKLYLNNSTTAIDAEAAGHLAFTLYPNPLHDRALTIRYEAPTQGAVVTRLYDLQGRLLQQQAQVVPAGPQALVLQVPHLPPGTYLLHLQHGPATATALVVVP